MNVKFFWEKQRPKLQLCTKKSKTNEVKSDCSFIMQMQFFGCSEKHRENHFFAQQTFCPRCVFISTKIQSKLNKLLGFKRIVYRVIYKPEPVLNLLTFSESLLALGVKICFILHFSLGFDLTLWIVFYKPLSLLSCWQMIHQRKLFIKAHTRYKDQWIKTHW